MNDIANPVLDEVATMPGHLLRRCQQIAVAMFHEECRATGLTPVQFAVLAALDGDKTAATQPLDQNRLGGLVALDRTTISLTVNKLAERGLVDKRAAPHDRRARHIVLTEAGRTRLRAALPAVRDVQARLLAPLPPDEQRHFVALLARIAEAGNASSRAPLKTR